MRVHWLLCQMFSGCVGLLALKTPEKHVTGKHGVSWDFPASRGLPGPLFHGRSLGRGARLKADGGSFEQQCFSIHTEISNSP